MVNLDHDDVPQLPRLGAVARHVVDVPLLLAEIGGAWVLVQEFQPLPAPGTRQAIDDDESLEFRAPCVRTGFTCSRTLEQAALTVHQRMRTMIPEGEARTQRWESSHRNKVQLIQFNLI